MKRIAVIRKLALPSVAVALGICSLNAFAADQDTADKREMLSKHETVAEFEGVSYHRCMGLTALCPDLCGESGDLASFRLLKYLAYEKPGQYGDPKQQRHQFLVQDNMKNVRVPAEIKASVEALQKGEFVLLNWQHDYVTKAGSKFPERTVQQLKRISREEADRLTGGLDKLPKDDVESRSSGPGRSAR